jgi:hypothetical protein
VSGAPPGGSFRGVWPAGARPCGVARFGRGGWWDATTTSGRGDGRESVQHIRGAGGGVGNAGGIPGADPGAAGAAGGVSGRSGAAGDTDGGPAGGEDSGMVDTARGGGDRRGDPGGAAAAGTAEGGGGRAGDATGVGTAGGRRGGGAVRCAADQQRQGDSDGHCGRGERDAADGSWGAGARSGWPKSGKADCVGTERVGADGAG